MAHEALLFTESHEWIEPAGEVRTVGITDHAQHLLGDIVYTELPKVGRKVKKGESMLVVESPKAAAEVYAPMSGEVVEVNAALEAESNLVNASPYGDGWLVRLRVSDPAEADTLLPWSKYATLIGG
jgi:glycine cleavage system H protein